MAPPPPAAGQPAGITLASLQKLPLPARFGVTAFVCGLIAAVYWVFFYSEVSSKIAGQKRQTSNLRAELANQQQLQATYLADRDELTLRQQRQRELNKVLPADTEVAGFLSSVQTVANASGLQLNAWQPREEVREQFFAKVPMSLELVGRFHQVVKFAYEIGKLDRVTNLENIDVADVKTVGDEVMLKVRCLATAFHALRVEEPKK